MLTGIILKSICNTDIVIGAFVIGIEMGDEMVPEVIVKFGYDRRERREFHSRGIYATEVKCFFVVVPGNFVFKLKIGSWMSVMSTELHEIEDVEVVRWIPHKLDKKYDVSNF